MMRTLTLVAVAALPVSLAAQTYSYAPHAIYQHSEGPSDCNSFGLHAAGRVQIVDATQAGRSMQLTSAGANETCFFFFFWGCSAGSTFSFIEFF